MGRRTLRNSDRRGFETLAAAVWLFVFGSLAILTQKFLVERKQNFSTNFHERSLSKAQDELNEVHSKSNERRWRSDDPRNKKWGRKVVIQRRKGNRKKVEHNIAFDPSPP